MDSVSSIKDILEQELSKNETKLAVFEDVALSVQDLLHNDETALAQVSQLLEKDPSITVKLLNLANSAMYAGLVKVKTIDAAVSRLGFKTVRNLVMAIILQDVYTGSGKALQK
ncbi:MAG: HDOD domain-containing protein, partial [Pseudomonadota bacterium]